MPDTGDVTAMKVEPGRPRSKRDGSRRFTPYEVTFDTRAMMLTTVIEDDWDEAVKEQWRSNQNRLREAVIYEHGVDDFEQKIQNFGDVGTAPWSVVALHNEFLRQVRQAFVSMHYYPALLGACGLGERILNQLVLTLRNDYSEHEATKKVGGKQSFDNWTVCIRTLEAWGVFDAETAATYKNLMKRRHGAVHYRTELDGSDARKRALEAVTLVGELIGRIFTPHVDDSIYFTGPIGRSFVRLQAENVPFVRRFILPSCVLVSPAYRYVSNGLNLDVYDDPEYGVGEPPLSDEEFADPGRATPQVPYPF